MTIFTTVLTNSISLICSVFLAVLIYYSHRQTPFKGYASFMGLTLCIVLWTAFFLFELTIPGLEAKLMMIKVEYLGIAFFPFFLVSYLMDTAEHHYEKTIPVKIALAAFGSVYVLCAWINPFGQFYLKSEIINQNGMEVISHNYGFILYLMHGLLSFAVLACVGSLLVSIMTGRTSPKRAWPLVVSAVFPFVANVFYLLKIIDFDPTNIALGVSATIIAVFMFMHGEVDTKKYIVHNIIELMVQPVIVLDSAMHVIYVNEPGQRLFGATGLTATRGELCLNDLIPECPDIGGNKNTYYEFKIARDGATAYYEMYHIPLKLRENQSSLIMINDITSKKKISDQLNYLRDWDTATGLINANRFMRILDEYRRSHDKGLAGTGISFFGVVNLDVIKAVMPM